MLSRIAAAMIVAAALALVWADTATAAECDAPKPTLNIGAPSPGGSAAPFAGVWRGSWPVAVRGHVLSRCARLYIAATGAQDAGVDQCTGSLPAAKRKAECKHYVAQITGNALTFTDVDGTVYTFTVADVGGMLGKRVSADHRSATVFTKAE